MAWAYNKKGNHELNLNRVDDGIATLQDYVSSRRQTMLKESSLDEAPSPDAADSADAAPKRRRAAREGGDGCRGPVERPRRSW